MIYCPDCHADGFLEDGSVCPNCGGGGVFLRVRASGDYFWGKEIEGNLSFFRSFGRFFRSSARIFSYSLALVSLVYGLYFVVSNNGDFFADYQADMKSVKAASGNISGIFFAAIYYLFLNIAEAFGVIFEKRGYGALFFWTGILGAMYFYYGAKTFDASRKEISFKGREFGPFFDENPERLKAPVDISSFASVSVMNILRKSLDLAHDRAQAPGAFHLAKILAGEDDVRFLMKRLEVDARALDKYLEEAIGNLPRDDRYCKKEGTAMSPEMKKMAISALYESLLAGFDMIEPEALFLALLCDPELERYFHDHKLDTEDIRRAVLWTRNIGKARAPRKSNKPQKIRHDIMNRAWTARITPELDQFSYDMTDYARSGLTGAVIGRERELDELMRILERTSQNNALLIGEEGSGRTSVVKALANRMIRDEVLPTLRDKRLVVLDITALVAGARAGGDLELRVQKVLEDMGRGGNIILYIPDIHNLAAAGSAEGFDASKILSPILSRGIFQIIGSTDYRNYRRYIEPRSDFADGFDKVRVEELSEADALKVLSVQAGYVESREGVTMTYGALRAAVELSKRYLPDRLLPGKAIDLLSETAVEVRRRGAGQMLREEDVAKIITEKTGIPLESINSDEAEKLLALEDSLHKRVIGQDQAIRSVASAIRRVRVGMKRENRPIGAFLFVGPTGVGKTELAKALAEVYYGNERAMVRLDMSEFQTVESVEKLIGYSSAENADSTNAGGILTEAIKHSPFSLLLLDELEKAHGNVLNLFLQVLDDGRLTDNLGRTVDFTNTIIIATSNAGSKEISKIFIDEKTDNGRILELLEPYLLQYFAPEFMNRFTDKIVFRSLSPRDLMLIAKLQIKELAKRLDEAQGIRIELDDEAVSYLAEAGYDAEYGARYLQRTMQEKLENLIAVEFLKGNIKRGDVFRVSAERLRQS